MVKVFKFRPKKEPKQDEQNLQDENFQNEQNFENESSVLNSQNSVGIFKFITIFWIVCLVLNLLNLTNELKFQSQIFSVFIFIYFNNFNLQICIFWCKFNKIYFGFHRILWRIFRKCVVLRKHCWKCVWVWGNLRIISFIFLIWLCCYFIGFFTLKRA